MIDYWRQSYRFVKMHFLNSIQRIDREESRESQVTLLLYQVVRDGFERPVHTWWIDGQAAEFRREYKQQKKTRATAPKKSDRIDEMMIKLDGSTNHDH